MTRILGDLRIFQAIVNDLKLHHELVTDENGVKRWAYVYDGVDPYELEDEAFPRVAEAFKTKEEQE